MRGTPIRATTCWKTTKSSLGIARVVQSVIVLSHREESPGTSTNVFNMFIVPVIAKRTGVLGTTVRTVTEFRVSGKQVDDSWGLEFMTSDEDV